jgi:hypothetical protein
MKFAWHHNVIDVAAWNLNEIEQVAVEEYKDLLIADVEHARHEVDADVVYSC